MTGQYVERRADGWPLCPRCGEDELYSLAVPATEATIVGCYRCRWTPATTTYPAVILAIAREALRTPRRSFTTWVIANWFEERGDELHASLFRPYQGAPSGERQHRIKQRRFIAEMLGESDVVHVKGIGEIPKWWSPRREP